MFLLFPVILGLAAGVGAATARVPRLRWGATIASLVVIAAGAWWIASDAEAGLASGIAYAASCLGGFVAYGTRLWTQRIPLDRRPPRGQLVWMTIAGADHLRARVSDSSTAAGVEASDGDRD